MKEAKHYSVFIQLFLVCQDLNAVLLKADIRVLRLETAAEIALLLQME